jgi:hypothetical protein
MLPSAKDPAFPTIAALTINPIIQLTDTLFTESAKGPLSKTFIENLSEPLYLYWRAFITEWNISRIFADTAHCINATHILSSIVAASLKEDTYGSVQQFIELIMNTFVDCLYALEQYDQYVRSTIYSNGVISNEFYVSQHADYIKLNLALESAIDRILTFLNPYLDQFNWTPATKRKLEQHKSFTTTP